MPRALTRRRIGAGLALATAVAIVLIVVLDNSPASAGAPNNNSALSNNPGVTSVQRRDLVETDTESGTLSYASAQTVYNNLSGTITWLPQVGQLIKPGQTLYKVDGVPVMLMNGSTPAFRDLSADDTAAPDILELNRNLISLGFNPDGIVADDEWQAATTAGVDVLQAYLGQTETGILSLGQVVFLPGAQLVSTLDETLGADPGGTTSGASLATSTAPASSTEFVDLHTGTTTTPQTTTSTRTTSPGQGSGGHSHSCHLKGSTEPRHKCSNMTSLQALIALLKAEIAELKAEKSGNRGSSGSGSGHSGGGSNAGGSGGGSSGGGSSAGGSSGGASSGGASSGAGGASTAVLQTTSTQLVVTVDLDASKQSEAKVGEKVTVEMPAGNFVNGTISAVSSVATSSSGSSGSGSGSGSSSGGGGGGSGGGGNSGSGSSSSSIPVTVTLKHTPKGAGLDQAAVSVNFAEAQAKNVLSVPVTALLAVPGGGYAVQEAAAPHKLVKVNTGLFAAGFVQISGPQIIGGLQVTNSEG